MFSKVLVANRGAIACRILHTLKKLSISSVAVYAEVDADSLHVELADEAFCLRSGGATDTYLDQEQLVRIATTSGAQAVHPGYGFLSENTEFANRLTTAGITFIGPSAAQIRQFGLKHEARALAQAASVNVLPGSPILQDVDAAISAAEAIGYPVMLKSTAGGGGIGMQRCIDERALVAAFTSVERLAQNAFGNAQLFVEKYIGRPRHVEVQAFGDGRGDVAIIGDRDCSLQRRHQKVIEECPAPNLPDKLRHAMHEQARQLLASVNYANAGTVEFLYDPDDQSGSPKFYFLEVNTRLQVEHGVTELVFKVDLVAWMLRQAHDVESLTLEPLHTLKAEGHAIQARVYAEDAQHDYRPTPGLISQLHFPVRADLRVDTWVRNGSLVPHQFDPLLAKVIAYGPDREQAKVNLSCALAESRIYGLESNLGYLVQVLSIPSFQQACMSTGTLAEFCYQPNRVDVVEPGANTSLQSFPGRQGYWAVGVPPSGPMDELSFRLGNRLLGNRVEEAGLEIVLSGPTLKFFGSTMVVAVGAPLSVSLDGIPQQMWSPFLVESGQTLEVGTIAEGMRAYLLFAGGFDLPQFLGSSATFALGNMGGLNGRTLRVADVLPLAVNRSSRLDSVPPAALSVSNRPDLRQRHKIRVLLGPHTAPDFFTTDDIDRFLDSDWQVHYNSSRTGIRLTGPQPTWARQDGGEAGLHPSNLHDNAYAFGSIDFTGDMPVILGPDGPSLGGFVCPAVVINADRWKLGQLMPGDKLRFVAVTSEAAQAAGESQEAYIQSLRYPDFPSNEQQQDNIRSPIVYSSNTTYRRLAEDDVVIRRAGQEWLLVEFGPTELSVTQRLRVQAFMTLIEQEHLPGIVEMTPGIRSLQIRFDMKRWRTDTLPQALLPLLEASQNVCDIKIKSRIVRLPLSWEDPACLEAVERYVQGVRKDAPWCPDNVEFIRRINGLASKQAVKDIVFDASYLVMGLGDVYLGAPVATPLDPRHRLVTTKYNPARTWTAENSVGIGGSYLCVYGMEGPGGYQFVGRTLQVWDSQQRGRDFTQPWLLRPFDQIQFYEVDAPTLAEMRIQFPRGEMSVDTSEITFDPAQYQDFLHVNDADIQRFTKARDAAFAAELQRWQDQGLLSYDTEDQAETNLSDVVELQIPPGAVTVNSPMSGSVWSVAARPGSAVQAGDLVLVLEAMKSEFNVAATVAGVIQVLVEPGQQVVAGQTLAFLQPANSVES